MQRGEIYRVAAPPGSGDPRPTRPYVVVSRNVLLRTSFSTAICAPVFSNYGGLTTQVEVGEESGLKHDSCIYCDNLMSLPRSSLTDFVGTLSAEKMEELNEALAIALAIEDR